MSRTTPEECSCRKRKKPYSMVKDDDDDDNVDDDEIDDEDVDEDIVMIMTIMIMMVLDSFSKVCTNKSRTTVTTLLKKTSPWFTSSSRSSHLKEWW